jgi:hypothetical protein
MYGTDSGGATGGMDVIGKRVEIALDVSSRTKAERFSKDLLHDCR